MMSTTSTTTATITTTTPTRRPPLTLIKISQHVTKSAATVEGVLINCCGKWMACPSLDFKGAALELEWNGYIVKCTVCGSNFSNHLVKVCSQSQVCVGVEIGTINFLSSLQYFNHLSHFAIR
ncbi:hypothetical protein CI102_87 [Trichoderma harzianum]|nr:hypothetical protein CI102_87 [Trichoderma harzianum]